VKKGEKVKFFAKKVKKSAFFGVFALDKRN
jgi:hypothetical protein